MALKTSFKIGKHIIGSGNSCFIIAEMSANHNQDFDTAVKILYEIKKAGADAVKLQTYTPDTLTINFAKGSFLIPRGNTFAGPKNLYELYKTAYMPWEFQPKLNIIAKRIGLTLFSTAYESSAVKFLEEELNPPAHKISSFEMNDDGLLRIVAKTGKPVIMSNGMATMEEIDHAVNILAINGCRELAILRCSSAYPSNPENMYLLNMNILREIYHIPVGVSDHTDGTGVAVAAAALGANVIEKHFTLDKNMKGPDHRFSMTPVEFSLMVKSVRGAEAAVKEVSFDVHGELEFQSRVLFRRSLYIVRDTKKGEKLTKDNLRSIRPGSGLQPRHLEQLLGLTVNRDVLKGTPMSWDLVK